MLETLCLTQLTFSAIMTGVIWIIQMVHYPAFRYIDPSKILAFHGFHTKGITPIVAPVMVIELVAGIALIHYAGIFGWFVTALNLILWLSTFLLQVPIHQQLSEDWDQQKIERLISTNWIRTITWTGKTLVIGYYILIIL